MKILLCFLCVLVNIQAVHPLVPKKRVSKHITYAPFSIEESTLDYVDGAYIQAWAYRPSLSTLSKRTTHLPFMTWKNLDARAHMLKAKDHVKELKNLMRSVEENVCEDTDMLYLSTFRKLDHKKRKVYLMHAIYNLSTQEALFNIITDPLARYLAKSDHGAFKAHKEQERRIKKAFLRKNAFFEALENILQGRDPHTKMPVP